VRKRLFFSSANYVAPSVLLFPGMFRSGTVSAGNAPEKNVSLYNLEAHVFQGSPQNSEKIVR
ncbi:hypothetical protein PQ801_006068, partial [Klebsiella pneumoniae]